MSEVAEITVPPEWRAQCLPADKASELISAHASAGIALAFVMDATTRRHLFLKGDFERYLGVSADALRADPDAWLAALEPVDRAQLLNLRGDLLLGRRVERTFVVCGGDGRRRTLHASLALRESPTGPLTIGIVTEIMGIEGVTGAANPFRLAVESGELGLAVTDGGGKFRYLNESLAELFRFGDRGDLLGREWSELCGRAAARELEAKAFPALAAHAAWQGVVAVQRRDGSTFQAAISLSRLPVGHLVWKCRDCSREIETSERLRRSESLLAELLDELPLGLILQGADSRIEFANRICRQWFGAGAGPEALAEIDATLRREPDYSGWAIADRQLGETNAVIFDFPFTLPSGGNIIWEVQKFRLQPAANGTWRICTMVTDVTARRELSRAAAALARRRDEFLAMQRELVAMVSHEFRTPLSAIQGVHFLLERSAERLPAELQPPFVRHLALQAKVLGNFKALVDEVLLLNQLDHAGGAANFEPADIAALLRQAAETFNGSLPAPRVELASPAAPVKAGFNPAQIRVVVDNLISNALKYSEPDTAVTVTLAFGEGRWRLAVRDRGRGIPEADQRRLFEPFFRAGNVAGVHGTGLGLAIVRRIVTAHGGTIGCESLPGAGTTFTVAVPLEPAAAEPDLPAAPWSRSPYS